MRATTCVHWQANTDSEGHDQKQHFTLILKMLQYLFDYITASSPCLFETEVLWNFKYVGFILDKDGIFKHFGTI